MKTFGYLLAFLFLASLLDAKEGDFNLSYETVAVDNVLASAKYRSLNHFDPGFHKTIVRMENYPFAKKFVLTLFRPLLIPGTNQKELQISREELLDRGRSIGENVPMIVVSSKGFYPGEKIKFRMVTKHQGSLKSSTIDFIPHPLAIADQNREAQVSAELRCLSPTTTYRIHLEGFRPDEKLTFLSRSFEEEVKHDLEFSKKICFLYSPGVTGQTGGKSRITITREDDTQMSLTIPWGTELLPHLDGTSAPVTSTFPTIAQRQK